jgi:hypothetical protein
MCTSRRTRHGSYHCNPSSPRERHGRSARGIPLRQALRDHLRGHTDPLPVGHAEVSALCHVVQISISAHARVDVNGSNPLTDQPLPPTRQQTNKKLAHFRERAARQPQGPSKPNSPSALSHRFNRSPATAMATDAALSVAPPWQATPASAATHPRVRRNQIRTPRGAQSRRPRRARAGFSP